jgi:hypothetical protein
VACNNSSLKTARMAGLASSKGILPLALGTQGSAPAASKARILSCFSC